MIFIKILVKTMLYDEVDVLVVSDMTCQSSCLWCLFVFVSIKYLAEHVLENASLFNFTQLADFGG